MQSIRQSLVACVFGIAMIIGLSSIATAQLPNHGLEIDFERTAIVITDL